VVSTRWLLAPSLASTLAAALACHPVGTVARTPAFQPTGAVVAEPLGPGGGGGEASFDEGHVTARVGGRGLELALGQDGRWSGTIRGRPAQLAVEPGRIAGPGVDLRVDERGGVLRVEGTLDGRTLYLALSDTGLSGFSYEGACAFHYQPVGHGAFRGPYSCPPNFSHRGSPVARIELQGRAAETPPPYPQLALALAWALPPY
jgi:hypothetical protein